MRWFILMFCLALSACSAKAPVTKPIGDIHAVISTRDIAMNRPLTDIHEAVFRMQADGTGTVEFIANPDGAQDIVWSLRAAQFCIQADAGLIASFECATLTLRGNHVTFAHTQSDNVATGVLIARQP